MELRLKGATSDPSTWRVEESGNLQQWEGAFPFTSGVCRRPITGTKRFWRAYQSAANPVLPFTNLGSPGPAFLTCYPPHSSLFRHPPAVLDGFHEQDLAL